MYKNMLLDRPENTTQYKRNPLSGHTKKELGLPKSNALVKEKNVFRLRIKHKQNKRWLQINNI